MKSVYQATAESLVKKPIQQAEALRDRCTDQEWDWIISCIASAIIKTKKGS